MTVLTTTYPGMSEDPIRDSQDIRRQELSPIVERLKAVLDDLEEYAKMQPADYDDDGQHGD